MGKAPSMTGMTGIALLGLALSAGCSGMKVSSVSAPGAEAHLQQFQTYAWLPEGSNQPGRMPFVRDDLMQAADRAARSQGLPARGLDSQP
ncbi:MAG: hypothetical protein QM765_51915 [Myxococcales bacterium]